MKLVIAIVNNEDGAVVSSALTKEGFFITKLITTGGFLMTGNNTFLIGAEDEAVPRVKEIIRTYSNTRKHAVPSTATFGVGLRPDELPTDAEVTVGGATVFVLSIDGMEKY
ncbi:MAG: cyclic-di-AMP receptor [Oscillospiraceae bacterium]|nr:cyclic-di-AMP receptor [Oscillospiraceae bacterium]